EEYYDDDLAEAVRAFQESQGLGTDGIVGGNTRAVLNQAASDDDGVPYVKKSTIIANMERWRWEARDFGKRHIIVNIPEFVFRLVEDGKIIHKERIVAGSRKHPTPIFTDEMVTVVFNPYWNVPKSILTKEILPAIRRDPSFIDRNRLEVVSGGRGADDFFFFDWMDVDPDKLRLRQIPGAGNALGNVKFLFPNKHSVYMHDTPTKHLFKKRVRAFSHGCMRVRNPLKFAEVLLADQGWSAKRVRNAVGAQNDYEIPLKRKVAVHIMYFTLWADKDGKIRHFSDIYGHDKRTKTALHLERARKAEVAENDEDAGEHGLGN
ncbi:MAG: L,D-transpeptidase family protein, partial [Alphaproteobacteria bacterium]